MASHRFNTDIRSFFDLFFDHGLKFGLVSYTESIVNTRTYSVRR